MPRVKEPKPRADVEAVVEKRGDRYHARMPTPGWGDGRLRITLQTNAQKTATERASLLEAVYAAGAWEVLDALARKKKDAGPGAPRISFARAKTLHDRGGVPGILDEVRRLASPDADSPPDELLLAPLIDPYLAARRTKARTREGTRRRYRSDLKNLVEYSGGPEGASVAHLRDRDHIEAWHDHEYYRRLAHLVGGRIADETWAAEHPDADPSRRERRRNRAAKRAEVAEFTYDQLDKLRTHEEHTAAGATANHFLIPASGFCGWLQREKPGLLEKNEVADVARFEVKNVGENNMSREEWRLFEAEAAAWDSERNIHLDEHPNPGLLSWQVLLATGATTYTECVNRLRLNSFRPTHEHKRQGLVPVEIIGTKSENRSNRMLWVPRALYDRVVEHCKRYHIADDELLFARPRGGTGARRPFTANAVLNAFNGVCDRLIAQGHPSFRRFTPYSLRHTFAVFAIMGDPENGIPGVDIVDLARMLGHGDNVKTTMRYAKYAGDKRTHGGAVVAYNAGWSATVAGMRDPLERAASALGMTEADLLAARQRVAPRSRSAARNHAQPNVRAKGPRASGCARGASRWRGRVGIEPTHPGSSRAHAV